jgi:soluble lytic murein transglycosylase
VILSALLPLALCQLPADADPLSPLLALDAQFEPETGRVALSGDSLDELGSYAPLVRARELRQSGKAAQIAALLSPSLKDADPLAAANAHLELGEAALMLGRPAEARAHQQKVFAQRQLPAELRARASEGLGRACAALGDLTGARAAFEQAAALDPEGEASERALSALGSLQTPEPKAAGHAGRQKLIRARRLLRRGQAQAALQELAGLQSGKRGGKADAALQGEIELCTAQCDRVLGLNEEAEIHLLRAREATTIQSGAAARIALARERELAGDWRGALEDLLQISELDARSKTGTDALYLAAFIALQHHEMDMARGLFRKLLPGRRWQHADEARWWLGWIDFQLLAFEDALDDWKPLLAGEGPSGVQSRFWAARAEEKLGRVAEADRLRAELVRISPIGYYALLLRAGALPTVPQDSLTRTQDVADPDPAWLLKLRRAELLWALGHADYAAEEMHGLVEHTQPDRMPLLSDVLAQLGDPGWAFTLALDHAPPGGVSPLSPTLFPRPYAQAVKQAARAAGVDPLLLWAIMRQESHFRTRARSAAQAFGPMQLLSSTSARIAAITGTAAGQPDDPDTALMTAAWYLRALMDRFGADPALAAAAYNAGPDALARWLTEDGRQPLELFVEEIPFRETRRYVRTVLANCAAYHSLFGEPDGPLIDPGRPAWAPTDGGEGGVDF